MHGHYPGIITYVGGISDELRRTLAGLDPRRIAINYSRDDVTADGLTHGLHLMLMEILEGTPHAVRLESSERIVAALRGRKSPGERARIRAACEVTVGIFERLSRRLRTGLTEKQVAAMILEEMEALGGLDPAWDAEHCPAVFTGPDSAGAHAGPTDRRIEPGHIMNVDFGVRKDGYCSDLQRTWYFLRPGETRPPEAVQRGFETIMEAIRAAAAAVRPGRAGAEIDQVARDHITSRGYPEFAHGLGHQIGRKAHDGGGGLLPRWERYGKLPDQLIEAGQCYTIEPRLPVEGHGIATCEDIVAVTDRGAEFLSRPQTELYVVGS
jgi:Xaa-Pro aminopeptidase